MADFTFAIFAADNFINPQNPGFLPAEDATFRSDLEVGDLITWLGGGTNTLVTVTDNVDGTFDEALNNQTLQSGVTFDGVTYSTGQIVTPTYTIVFDGDDGNTYTLTSFNFSPNTNNEIPDAVFWEGAIPPPGTVLTVTSEINPTGGNARDFSDFVTCFCSGTLIDTAQGPKPVEDLKAGDWVRCIDGTFQELLAVLQRHVTADELAANAKLIPVKITAGALGNGLPARDTWVSRQHRFHVSSPICERMFGARNALIAAVKLTELPGIYADESVSDTTYWHLILPQHSVIFANFAPSESFHLGSQSLKALSSEALEEIETLFPGLKIDEDAQNSAAFIPSGRDQKTLVRRHLKNKKPLVASG